MKSGTRNQICSKFLIVNFMWILTFHTWERWSLDWDGVQDHCKLWAVTSLCGQCDKISTHRQQTVLPATQKAYSLPTGGVFEVSIAGSVRCPHRFFLYHCGQLKHYITYNTGHVHRKVEHRYILTNKRHSTCNSLGQDTGCLLWLFWGNWAYRYQGAPLLTWFNFNPSKDK